MSNQTCERADERVISKTSHLSILPETKARDAQLLRLGLVRRAELSSEDQAIVTGELPTDELKKMAREYLQECELFNKPKTVQEKTEHLGKFFWYLHTFNHARCGEPELRGFISHIKNGHTLPHGRWGLGNGPDGSRYYKPASKRTVQAYYVTVRTFYAWLMEKDYLIRDPASRVKIQRPTRSLIEPFTREQVEALIRAARVSDHPQRNEAIVRFLYDTGLREAEFCNMRLLDLDFNNAYGGKVRIVGKGDKERVVPFSMKTRVSLANYLTPTPERERRAMRNAKRRARKKLEALQSAPVSHSLKIWTSQRGQHAGQPLTPNGLYLLFRRLGEAARIHSVRCSPHTMRHTFAVEYLRNGGRLEVLQELMGHESVLTTRKYIKLAMRDLEMEHKRCSPGDSLEI